ncbi:MAG TPA: polysaccharide deacetylase family protein [Planctomycetaceae bacterium]|nr:polysaccharide deacetylase family protein [Planctomycetaceae bacterium]
MIARNSKQEWLARTLNTSGCGRMLRSTAAWRGVLILNYHRIGDSAHSDLDRGLWSATVDDFDRQVREVTRQFDVIGLDDLEEVFQRRKGRHVLITFDDGYLDNYTEAFPILKSHNAKATFFLTTGFLDVPRVPWWDEIAWMVHHSPRAALPANRWTGAPVALQEPHSDRAIVELLRTYKRLLGDQTEDYVEDLSRLLGTGRCPRQIAHELWMTWPMIREMRQAGMDIGGHTVNHPILANLPPEQQDDEIRECRRRIVAELREPISAFSYPVGGKTSFDEHTRTALERHDFRWGFTYLGGHVRFGKHDRFSLPRSAVETDVNETLFQGVLTLPQVFA